MLERAGRGVFSLVLIAGVLAACADEPTSSREPEKKASPARDRDADAGNAPPADAAPPATLDPSAQRDAAQGAMDAATEQDADKPAPDATADAEIEEPCVTRVCAEEIARRAESVVTMHAAQAWPAKGTCWGDVTWAFAALYTGSDVAGGNALLAALPATYATATELTVEPDCYWAHTLIARLLLHPQTAALVDAAARAALLELMWSYVQARSTIAEAAGTVWMISGSENHDTMARARTCCSRRSSPRRAAAASCSPTGTA